MQDPGIKHDWCKDLWDFHNVLKDGFVGWLALLNRLQTGARLASIGVCPSNQSLLCETGTEDNEFISSSYILISHMIAGCLVLTEYTPLQSNKIPHDYIFICV